MQRLVGALAVVLAAPSARAGMPFLTLTEGAAMRLEAIGFFVGLFFFVAAIVRGLWAVARRDVPLLPQPSYRASLAFVFTVALLLQAVLAMISGARELMTPGAWEKRGLTYRLKNQSDGIDAVAHARVATFERLRDALSRYASAHDNRFPANDVDPSVPDDVWNLAGSAVKLVYLPGARSDDDPPHVIAYEPGPVGRQRLALKTDGSIILVDAQQLDLLLRPAP
jgi:hypothetical protein